MILSLMSFGNLHWLHNPLEIKLENRALDYTRILPEKGEKHLLKGRAVRVIKGKGELVGQSCTQRFREIYETFKKGETGVLSLPGFSPLYARFTALDVVGDTTPDLLTYSFEFTEENSFEDDCDTPEYTLVKEGETLYDVAYRQGMRVEKLVELNPQIMRPDKLLAGERIALC